MFTNLNKLIVLHLFIGIVVCNATRDDYFSSVDGLEELLATEFELAAEMQNYIDKLTQHIDILQRQMNLVREEHSIASENLERYLNNPINAYRLIKRLHTDWPIFEETVILDRTRSDFLKTFTKQKQNLSFPTNDDMFGSTMALVRLQETYRLDVAQVASGILNGVKYGTSMTWQDCFAIGESLYAMNDYNHTISWFKQSTKMLWDDESLREDRTILEFMLIVAEYHRAMGDYESALDITEKILQQDSENESAKDLKQNLEDEMKNDDNAQIIKDNWQKTSTNAYHDTLEFKLYEQACRGEFDNLHRPQQKLLLCHLVTNNDPYRFLQPYKIEQYSLDPFIIQVYDVITDQQMNTIKSIAKPYLERSTVYSEDNGDNPFGVAHYRVSKTAWLNYNEHAYTELLRQHVASITGLNCNDAEDAQIVNYGMGGHYEPHYDFFTEPSLYDEMEDNRISTAMFYLSDVEEGGGTAYPYLKILVSPRKGSMLFWYNLHASGDLDYRTSHGACPVLKGSKWIANIWLRERDQFLSRPCDLTTNHKCSLKYRDTFNIKDF